VLAVPWDYLSAVGLLTAVSLVLVTATAIRLTRRPAISILRRL
jgi:hypothetical protein